MYYLLYYILKFILKFLKFTKNVNLTIWEWIKLFNYFLCFLVFTVLKCGQNLKIKSAGLSTFLTIIIYQIKPISGNIHLHFIFSKIFMLQCLNKKDYITIIEYICYSYIL